MKVNQAGGANFIPGGYRAGKVDAYKKSQSVSRGDEASLSGEAVAFSRVMASIKGTDSETAAQEADRIAAVKQQVQSGEYRVSGSDVAESILGKLYG